jgi:hypothetical protein
MDNLSGTLKELQLERVRAAQEVRRLDEAIAALGKIAGRNHAGRTSGRKPKRTVSAAGRRRIAAAQRARWAKWKARHGAKAA